MMTYLDMALYRPSNTSPYLDTRSFFNEGYIYIYIRVILKLLLILVADPHMCSNLIVANAASPASSSVINLILFDIMTQNLKGICTNNRFNDGNIMMK